MKAIILTYAGINEKEKALLQNTNIFKLAINQHAEELKPHARIISDYILQQILKNFPQKIISVREKLRFKSDRTEYPEIEFKGSTIICAIDYLILKRFRKILIIGDNNVNSAEFQTEVNNQISKITDKAAIYQYKNGNFNLPVMSVEKFLLI